MRSPDKNWQLASFKKNHIDLLSNYFSEKSLRINILILQFVLKQVLL